MPELVRFLLFHAAVGFALAVTFVAGLMFFNVNGLWTLIWGSEQRYLALFILTFFTGLTFGSVQISVAVMLLGQDSDYDGGLPSWLGRALAKVRGWLPVTTGQHELVPVPVPVKKSKR